MGYTNKDRRIVNISKKEKTIVKRLRRQAEKRQLKDEHTRHAVHATRRGWWYA